VTTFLKSSCERTRVGPPQSRRTRIERIAPNHWRSAIATILGSGVQYGTFRDFRGILSHVDLSGFYERVEKLISDLGASGHEVEHDEPEVAIRGGTTSGEVLGRLSAALPAVANSLAGRFRREGEDLAAWASGQLRS
jgi:hypothetical protein